MIAKRHMTMYLSLYGRHYLSITPFFSSQTREKWAEAVITFYCEFYQDSRVKHFFFLLCSFSHTYYMTEKIVHTITSTYIFTLSRVTLKPFASP